MSLSRHELPDPTDRSSAWCLGQPTLVRWVEVLRAERDRGEVLDLSHEVQHAGLLLNFGEGCVSLAALERIAGHGPLHEYGAGLGYTARMLSDLGADVIASDPQPGGLGTSHGAAKPWFDTLSLRYGEGHLDSRTPLIVWPFENALDPWLTSSTPPTRLIIVDGRPNTPSSLASASLHLPELYTLAEAWSADVGWRRTPDFVRVWQRK